jgi:hypothetical protein
MRTITHVYDCGPQGEIEGMFDEYGKLLGTWCSNDATWRDEYFADFMDALDITVVEGGDRMLVRKLRKAWRED